ncbi:MAG: pyruvate kinase [Parcubacteria group bacterium GW2011_GWC2_49_9]|nr:MAG: pyruvate kinase [Parcubacteria group bacterium GW2011_GWC2_49_9]
MFIVATISKNSYPAEKIREIIDAGAEVLRFNFSHGSPDEMYERVLVAKNVIREAGKEGTVKIMADLPGDKLRLGKYEPTNVPVHAGDTIRFKSGGTTPDPHTFVPVDVHALGTIVKPGQEISVADGDLRFRIKDIVSDESCTAVALNAGEIPSMKAFNIGQGVDSLNHLTKRTVAHMAKLSEMNPDWVALSFVNSAAFVEKARTMLKEKMHTDALPPLVAKIETLQAVERIDEIAQSVDVLMVARGDLAITARAAKRAGKPVIVSTQILDSLVTHLVPTRSEILDLTNIVLDGADGIMFAKETGISPTPGYSVKVARKIIEAVEKNRDDM